MMAKMIPLEQLVMGDVNIRDAQTKQSTYQDMKRSIAVHGVQQPILVRPMKNPETKEVIPNLWQIIDGCQRSSILKDLGIEEAPCEVRADATDDDCMILQYMLNKARVNNTPKQDLEHLKKYAILHPNTDADMMATDFCMKPEKIKQILKLDKLTPSILELVDKGDIKMTHALALATLPLEMQESKEVLENIGEPSDRFTQFCAAIRKAEIKARREGSKEIGPVIVMTPLRRDALIQKHQLAENEVSSTTPDHDDYNILVGRLQMIKEVLQIDPITLAEKEAKRVEKKIEAQEAKALKAEQEKVKVMESLKKQKQEATANLETVEGIV